MTGDSGMFGHVWACLFRSELLPGETTDMSWHVDQLYLIVSGVISDLVPVGTTDLSWHVD